MRPRRAAVALLLAVAVARPLPLFGCAIGAPRPAFSYNFGPDDRGPFLDGEVGILTPHWREPYLYVAYRHIAGLGLDAASRAAVEELWRPPGGPWRYDAVREWRQAAARFGDEPSPRRELRPQRVVPRADGRHGGFFVNCLEDAFRTAAATLSDRAARHGAGAPEIGAWIEAQWAVFSNCGGGRLTVPEPLAAEAHPLARADREYQIAAALFYGLDYDGAADRFRRIAADRASPWSDLAAYLEARAFIRSWSIGGAPRDERLGRALAALERILADPGRAAVHDMAAALRRYVALRLDADATRQRLRRRLTADRLASTVRQDLIDYRWTLDRITGADLAGLPDLDRWLMTFRPRQPRRPLADAGPGVTGDERWLAAALILASSREPEHAVLLEAAARVPVESPIYATAAYHRARLLVERREVERARAALAAIPAPALERLSLGDRNRIGLLRARVAPTLAERIELGQRIPIAYSDEIPGDHPLATAGGSLRAFAERTLPADVAVNALNLSSLDRLAALLTDRRLEPALHRRLAPLVWTRAALLGREEVALALQEVVTEALPVYAPELAAYRAAAPGDERRFSAALSILRFPGLRPTLRHGFGRRGMSYYGDEPRETEEARFSVIRDNWWCASPWHGLAPGELSSLVASDRAEAERSLAETRDWEAAPTHLGNIVLGWGETHRADARVPEALHRVVAATRVCGHGDISRVAFHTLHGRYPTSPWAAKTKYWYD